ncbi:MAG: glycosyltransferase family 39 protein, partial [Phycisphaerae bacterium]
MPDSVTRRRYIGALIVAASCLVAELVVLAEQQASDPTFRVPIIDAATYHEAALRFADGNRLIDDAFWQPPMFPLVLGCLYRTFGGSVVLAKLFLAVVGAGSGVLVWWIGCRVFSARVGLIAGLILAGHGPFLLFNSQLLPTGLAVFFDLAAIALWLRCLERPCWYRWLAFGLVAGAATITVPNAGVLVVVAAVMQLVARGGCGDRAKRVAACCLMLLGTVISVGMVTARNYVVSGQFVVLSTNGGINFYIGNNADSDRTVAIRPGDEWKRLVRRSFGDKLPTRAEQSTYFLRKGLGYAAEHPVKFLAGLVRKASRLVNARELPRNIDPYVCADHSLLVRLLMWRAGPFAFPFGSLMPLAIVGAVVGLREGRIDDAARRGRAGLLGFAVLYGASIVVFFVSGRYRIPMAVMLIPFAAFALERVFVWLFRRRSSSSERRVSSQRGKLPVEAVTFVLVGVLVNSPIHAPTDAVNFRGELLSAVGDAHAKRDELDRAEAYLRQAVEL